MAQRQLYSGLDLYDWRGTGPNGRTKAVDVDKWQQNQEDIRHLPGAFPVQSVVITDGQITPTAAALSVDTEGGAPADDLTAIAPGDLHAGMLLALCSVDTGRKVTIKNSAGASGIQTLDGKDVVLDTQYAVMLRLVSTESLPLWREEPGPLRLQLTVSTPDTLGGVKVQTGDDDGLEMIGDKLRARQANATQRGSVLASTTAAAGAVPTADVNGVLDETWLKIAVDAAREAMDAAREAGNNSLPKASAGYRLIVSSTDTEHSGDYVIKSSELPANIALNSTYDIENPFGDIPCIVVVEIKDSLGGVWSPQAMAQPNSANNTNDYIGVYGGSVGDIIRVTTGRTFLSRRQRMDGWLGSQGDTVIRSAPCRVHVWKLRP